MHIDTLESTAMSRVLTLLRCVAIIGVPVWVGTVRSTLEPEGSGGWALTVVTFNAIMYILIPLSLADVVACSMQASKEGVYAYRYSIITSMTLLVVLCTSWYTLEGV